jgi:hypothetical protein
MNPIVLLPEDVVALRLLHGSGGGLAGVQDGISESTVAHLGEMGLVLVEGDSCLLTPLGRRAEAYCRDRAESWGIVVPARVLTD